MSLSLVVHLGLHRRSCLIVAYSKNLYILHLAFCLFVDILSVGKPGRHRVDNEGGDTWQAGQEASLHPRQKSSQGDGSQIWSWSMQLQGFFF